MRLTAGTEAADLSPASLHGRPVVRAPAAVAIEDHRWEAQRSGFFMTNQRYEESVRVANDRFMKIGFVATQP